MTWRSMTAEDLAQVHVLADTIHVSHPEDFAVLAERQRLYPEGCLMLTESERAIGYALTHPWRLGEPPPLNELLGELPAAPTTYYIHDVALLPVARGKGYAGRAANRLIAHARAAGFDESVARRRQQVSSVLGESRVSRAGLRGPGGETCELWAGCGAHGARSGKPDTRRLTAPHRHENQDGLRATTSRAVGGQRAGGTGIRRRPLIANAGEEEDLAPRLICGRERALRALRTIRKGNHHSR